MNDFDFMGLDIETSTSDPDTGNLLSIGAVIYETGANIYLEVDNPLVVCNPESMEVNKLNLIDLKNRGHSLNVVDAKMVEFYDTNYHHPHPERAGSYVIKLIPLGLNVGSFDMNFVKKFLPMFHNKVGYRTTDLNALFFSQAKATGESFRDVKKQYKKLANEMAERASGKDAHHALFDAYAACFMYAILNGTYPNWMQKFQ